MTALFFCVLAFCLAALACTPALVSMAPIGKRRLFVEPVIADSDFGRKAIELQVHQTQNAVRETDPRQRRLVEVSRIVQESDDVRSIFLTNVDDSELPDFRSGQHLIVERPASINTRAMSRCYTLSNGPKQKPWRITVRRASNADESNSMSNWIHEELQVGYRLRVRGPRGSFVLDKADSKKPVVFVAAGVGITPMASMLYDELNFARSRPKWLFYQVRTWDTAPLLMELVSAIESSNTCTAYIAASRDVAPTDSPMKHVKLLQGRFVPRTIFEAVGTFDVSVFLCGPCDWMLEMRQHMLELGVPQGQIHEEAFGAPEVAQAKAQSELKSSEESQFQYDVSFELSSKKAVSCGESKDLLTLAKANAIQIPASCRSGHCGTCAVKLLRGTVKYLREPQAEIVEGEILPCICYPTSDIAIQA